MSVPTSAHVDIAANNNATWEDAFQFGVPGDTSWSFTGQNFRLDIKGNLQQASPLLSVTSGAGYIVVSDPVNRILYMNVPEVIIGAGLIPGEYIYDLIMYDGSNPPIRIVLMHGKFILRDGVTGG